MKNEILPLKKSQWLYLLLFILLIASKKTYAINGEINLSFSSRVLNTYTASPREIQVLLSTDFNGLYDYGNVIGSTWIDISNRFTFPSVDSGVVSPAGISDISDLLENGKPFYIAFRYKTTGVPPAAKIGRNWRIESYSLAFETPYATRQLANHTSAGWNMVSQGNVDPGRGGIVQSSRLNFLANNVNLSVGIDEWAISQPVNLSFLNLSFSTRVLNSYELNPREITVLASTDFNGNYTYADVTAASWVDISDRYTFPVSETGSLTPAGVNDITDLLEEGKPIFIAFRYKTIGLPPAERMGRNWRVEAFSLESENTYASRQLTSHTNAGWNIVSQGNVDPGRGGTVQTTRLNFLANNVNQSVAIDEWAVSRPINLSRYSLSFSTRVLNSYEIDPREITILASTDFNGNNTYTDVTAATWTDISNRFVFPKVDAGVLTAAGKQDISDLIVSGKPLFIAYKYKTTGRPPATRIGRNWRVELFSLTGQSATDTLSLANQSSPGWSIISKGNVDPGRGGTVQTSRLNFLANNVNESVGIEEWAVSKPIDMSLFRSVYYVDAENGNDNNNGTSPETAWKTLSAVNATVFGPGAKILFKADGVWIGQLKPQGSGITGQPVIIDKYGSGEKPLINANGVLGGALTLHNQSFWEINNLELTNDASAMGDRNGVEVFGEEHGLVQHIHLKNLDIHHIKGISDNGARTAGVLFRTISDDVKDTRFDDVLIEGCKIYHVQNQGIHFRTPGERGAGFNYPETPDWERRKFTNIAIRNNIIHHISKNAILLRTVEGGIVERNLCYETALDTTGNTIFTYGAKGTVFQYNEGYLNRSPGGDGSLYDADLGSPGTIWQYSYSHDNAHGLMWFIPDERDDNIIVRYNISQNDKGNLVRINFPFTSAYIYNNVFYVDSSLSPTIIREDSQSSIRTYHFYNNIIYNLSPTATYNFVTGTNTTRIFSNNIFYGYHPSNEPADPFKITSDPLFVDPGTATTGLNTVGGYKLKPGSPALGAGKLIANNGGRDYFGLPVSATANPNIGFYNGEGTNVAHPDTTFHLYLLIGQSNMAGRGTITSEYAAMSHPRVKMLNANNEWVTAKHPLHFDIASPGVGPGLEFAIKMAEANPDVTIGLVPSAVGATGIDLWQPGGYDSAKDVYPYDDALVRAKRAMLSGVMKGILWHQGEGNSSESSSNTWPGKVKVLIDRLRSEFANNQLPFIVGELSYERSNSHYINDKLPQLVSEVPYTAIASASGLTAFDITHFDSPSATILGERYAIQMQSVQSVFSMSPTTLIAFNAFKKVGEIELNWITSPGLNKDWFELERSADGKIFTPLGRVEGKINTNINATYQFYDQKPVSGINYYRLKQTDRNGKLIYSSHISVYDVLSDTLLNSITVYPNPTDNAIFVRYPEIGDFKAKRLIIINSEGKKCGEKIIYQGEEKSYDVSSFTAGLYYIELKDLSGKSLGRAKFIRK